MNTENLTYLNLLLIPHSRVLFPFKCLRLKKSRAEKKNLENVAQIKSHTKTKTKSHSQMLRKLRKILRDFIRARHFLR